MPKCEVCDGLTFWREDTGWTCWRCGRSGYRHQPTAEELMEKKRAANDFPMVMDAPLETDCPECLGRGKHGLDCPTRDQLTFTST